MKHLNSASPLIKANPSQPPLDRGGARFVLTLKRRRQETRAANAGTRERAKPAPPLSRGGWEGFSSPRYLTTITIAAALFACLPAANADTLGRLFFTPEQRQQLDFGYARNATADGGSSAVLTVNGIVQKNGGARTVWVNGISQSPNNSERNPIAQTVDVPGKAHPVKLKVGDRILLDQPAPATQESPVQ